MYTILENNYCLGLIQTDYNIILH